MKTTDKKLTSLNDLFRDNTNVKVNIEQISIEKLVPFRNHPFKLYKGARLDDMVRSIKELGVLMPLLVRSNQDGMYEILSGHNRLNAAKIAGISQVPVRIMENIDDTLAMLIVTETNLIQRSFNDLLPSERACVLEEHHNAIKSQGKRKDLIEEIKMLLDADEFGVETTSDPVGQKLDSREQVGQSYDLGTTTVARYLRINLLLDSLKNFVDENEVSIRAAVEISYLSEENQAYLVGFLNSGRKVDMNKAQKLRELQKKGKLNEIVMEKVLDGSYKPRKPKSVLKGYKIDSKTMKKFFNENQNEKEVKEILEAALEMYFSHQGGT